MKVTKLYVQFSWPKLPLRINSSTLEQTQTQQWLNYFQTSSLGTSLKTNFPARQLLASSSFMTSEASRERTRE